MGTYQKMKTEVRVLGSSSELRKLKKKKKDYLEEGICRLFVKGISSVKGRILYTWLPRLAKIIVLQQKLAKE